MKPPVPYFGGKQTIAPWIVSLLPDHDHYVEPYCGGLSVLLAKPTSKIETVNDLDGQLMTFWRVLRDQPADLIRACALTPHSRAELLTAREDADTDLETARRVWVRLTQSQGGALRKAGWRFYINPDGTNISMPGNLTAYVDRMAIVAERLHRVSLESMPALDLIAKYGAQPKALLYVDPPYLGEARANGSRYRHEMKHPDEHRELAAALTNCKAAVVLSGYHSPLYDELFDGWHHYEQATATGNGKGDKGRTEVLWSNRRLGSQLDLLSLDASA